MYPLDEQPPLILVVDDEQAVLDEVAAMLLGAGLDCRCCTSASEAMEEARLFAFDLIIADVNLCGHSGVEMCDRIRRNETSCDVPAMFLSGGQIPDIIRRRDAAGGSYYVRKPFDPGVLLQLIDKALGMSRLADARRERSEVGAER
jgi:CheY-like chemotaxis protein